MKQPSTKTEMSRFHISPEEDCSSSNSDEYSYQDLPKKVPLSRWDCFTNMSEKKRNIGKKTFIVFHFFLKPIWWHWWSRESKLSPRTQPGQEEVWDRICESLFLKYFHSIRWFVSWPLFHLHSTRATPHSACPCSTSAMPSWAAASWACRTQWPTLASPCLCKFVAVENIQGKNNWIRFKDKPQNWYNTTQLVSSWGDRSRFVICVKVTGSNMHKWCSWWTQCCVCAMINPQCLSVCSPNRFSTVLSSHVIKTVIVFSIVTELESFFSQATFFSACRYDYINQRFRITSGPFYNSMSLYFN